MIDKTIKASSKIDSLRIFRKFSLNIAKSKWLPSSLRTKLYKLGGVNIGNNVFMGHDIDIDTIRPDLITIGDNTLITGRCVILTHFYKDGSFFYGDVNIGKGCFIGMNTIIANSVIIGDGAVVGAGSIVTKDIPSGEVWAGNPAKFIKLKN